MKNSINRRKRKVVGIVMSASSGMELRLVHDEISNTTFIASSHGLTITDCPSSISQLDIDRIKSAVNWYQQTCLPYSYEEISYTNLKNLSKNSETPTPIRA